MTTQTTSFLTPAAAPLPTSAEGVDALAAHWEGGPEEARSCRDGPILTPSQVWPALWERQARRYHGFDHIKPEIDVATSGDNVFPYPGPKAFSPDVATSISGLMWSKP